VAPVDVYVEVGSKRVFAGALGWPGWCRSGRDEDAALEALTAYAPRYADAVRGMKPAFRVPRSPTVLSVVERLKGDATTDFGAPSVAPRTDAARVDAAELARLERLLASCWRTLDRAAEQARGRKLRAGPRGGGRTLAAILDHVSGAEAAYLRRLGAGGSSAGKADGADDGTGIRRAIEEALDRAVVEGQPKTGPRGGKIWLPRYFVRRTAWHALDHAWEIEDRSSGGR
jgi:hypothetical protein